MSIVNAVTIFAENLQTANIVAGNTSSNLTITANSVRIAIGSNVVVNSTAISVGNSTINTVVNSTSIAAANITLNGVTYSSVAPSTPMVDYQVFTNPAAANFWYKPSWAIANDIVTIQMWGGGGGGGGGAGSGGGGGGACVIVYKLAGECNSVCNVVVGAGGAQGVVGQTSLFYTNSIFSISAYGGGGANSTTSAGGGGWFSAGQVAVGGNPLGGSGTESTFGGGGGGFDSVYGGGGGGGSGLPGRSVYGGSGGTGTAAIVQSIFGGNGGNNTVAATAPGGGGGSNASLSTGARGEVRIWVTPSRI